MPGDVFALWLLVIRTGLNVSALVAIGFALHPALGIVERDGRPALIRPSLAACLAVLIFSAARLGILTLQLGDGSTLFDLTALALG